MKGIDLFCSSPDATAVRSGMSPRARRFSYHLQSPKLHVPCSSSSRMPLIPRPYEKSRRSISDHPSHELRRKSSADVSDLRSRSCSSSRYLLRDHHRASVDNSWLLKSKDRRDSALATLSSQFVKPELVKKSSNPADSNSPAFKSSITAGSRDQVVVLKVSIHCKGCVGKVRKHISKMEGVTSFSIDLERKKVTVVGDVNPSGVLASISKVKSAQFWPSPSPQPLPSSSPIISCS